MSPYEPRSVWADLWALLAAACVIAGVLAFLLACWFDVVTP